MFQEYNASNIESKFIKGLLRNTYVPTVQVWKLGKPIIEGFTYVTRDYIVTAKVDNDGTGPTSPSDVNYFDVKEPYVWGEFYKGVSSNYVSNSAIYDAGTHEQLGNYLRMIRDLYDIDLMPYYNCWNGTYSDTIRLIETQQLETSSISTDIKTFASAQNDAYKVLIVPIKFNTDYTIYLNCDNKVTLGTTYYDNGNLVKSGSSYKLYHPETIYKCSYTSPYVYKKISPSGHIVEGDSSAQLMEEYLTLLIQVPESNKSPILILEGDRTGDRLINVSSPTQSPLVNRLKEVHFGTPENILEKLSEDDYSKYFTSPSSLTHRFSSKSYAFNDRLLEYLLLNVIDLNDTTDEDIARTQEYISSFKSKKDIGERYQIPYTKGIWDKDMRAYIYDVVSRVYKTPLCLDLNGYVDKDTEKILLRGKN